MSDTHLRSITKAICYRLTNTGATIVLVYIFTNDIHMSISIGFFEIMAKILFFYIYERIWSYIKWGKKS